ncbi:hypothetical protein DPMN_034605 [Dreissena polymorpha]|uniref:Uncharacterized protein n=1 Tax=Dreissena polymorpha TaxID=45954 RepID=A0A9D4M7Z2_DREPO|nr:hypothetical protein DPMN_034605 [Dreissena polymorpha]
MANIKLLTKFYIIGINLLTKCHEDRKINVASRVLTRKNAPPPGSHVFQPTGIIFELVQDIIGMNLLTKFHEDRTVNVASRVLTRFYYSHIRKNAPPHGSHFFQANIIIFKLIQDIIETNLQTKFHEDWTINVASRVLIRFYYSHIRKNIIGTNLLTKFHDDRKINVTSRVLRRKIAPPPMNLLTEFHENQNINVASRVKNAPPFGGHVFQANVTIFELIQDIIKTNLLTKFHQDWTINVASRVLTRKNAPPPGGHFHEDWTINVASRVKNALPLGSHVFQAKVTISELIQDNMLTRFYYSHIKKNAPPPGGHFYEDRTINVASRVKNAPPLGSHVFQANVTIFVLIQDIIETNLLTKFHEDWTINVASRE